MTADDSAAYLRSPRCNAPLPFEPGPACAREPGHPGDHITVSGLFRWSQDVAGVRAGAQDSGPRSPYPANGATS